MAHAGVAGRARAGRAADVPRRDHPGGVLGRVPRRMRCSCWMPSIPREVVRVLEHDRISVATLVPAMLQACLVTRRSSGATNGCARSTTALRRSRRTRCGRRSTRLVAAFVQSYGMTEAAQALTFLSPADHELALRPRPELLLSAGRPAPGPGCRSSTRPARGAGREPGEILARGPQLMSGYWQRREETAQTLARRWLHTGDVGRSTTTDTCSSRTASRTWSSPAARTCTRGIVEDVLFAHPASPRQRSSACPTTVGARRSRPSSRCGLERPVHERGDPSRSAARAWADSSARAPSTSSTSCRARRPARCSSACSASPTGPVERAASAALDRAAAPRAHAPPPASRRHRRAASSDSASTSSNDAS